MSNKKETTESTEELALRKRALCLAIEKECGFRVRNAADYSRLSKLIYDKMHELISETTLKRLFNYIEGWQNPRPSVWDILCRYAGYVNEDDFLRGNGISPEAISGEILSGRILCNDLKPGGCLTIRWYPDHSVRVEYLGDCEFKILESSGTSLMEGGYFHASVLVNGDSLTVSEYYPTSESRDLRDGGILYEIGREGGIEVNVEFE